MIKNKKIFVGVLIIVLIIGIAVVYKLIEKSVTNKDDFNVKIENSSPTPVETQTDAIKWNEITKNGVDEEALVNNINQEELKTVASKLQGLTTKIGEKEKEDFEYVLKAGWAEDYPVSEEFNFVINMGPKVMKELYFIIYKSENQGLYEYLCARALEKISGKEYGLWATSKEFLEKFNENILTESNV